MSRKSVAQVYEGKNVFITGATGFMGKVLVEKLLRSCSDVAAIYLLVRPKRDKGPKERLNDFLKIPLFDKIREMKNAEDVFSKVQCISGDVTQENLNLSNDDLQLLRDNVDLVFHMAANVRFDQPLKSALYMNTGGTIRVLDLATSFKNLKGFIHVSTSYCHCDQEILEEKIYQAPHNPRKMLDLVSWMEEDNLKLLTPKLLKNAPNTYAYTKCLTEQLVTEYAKKLPLSIARPSIVTSCMTEPLPGWVDNFHGPTGLIVGAGKGVIRTMHCNANLPADLVPVDMAINGLILVGKEMYERERSDEIYVVNITSGKDNQITWGDALEIGKKHFYENPFSICLWYPGGSIKSNYYVHLLAVFFFHLIPAYLVDFLLILARGKPFLVRTQKRIQSGLEILQYYTIRPWYFKNDRIKELTAKLNEKDYHEFGLDFFSINWDKYIYDLVLGARLYCVKESHDTVPYARKVLKRLYYLDLFKNIVLGCLLFWFLWSWSSALFDYSESVLESVVTI